MIGRIVEIVLGIALVVPRLRDVFDTVVAPGESGALQVAGRLLLVMLPVRSWKRLGRRRPDFYGAAATSRLRCPATISGAWTAI
jgi:hypothetical protein